MFSTLVHDLVAKIYRKCKEKPDRMNEIFTETLLIGTGVLTIGFEGTLNDKMKGVSPQGRI